MSAVKPLSLLDTRRRIFELRGYEFKPEGCKHQDHAGKDDPVWIAPDGSHLPEIPGVEYDPTESEELLIKICAERSWAWDLYKFEMIPNYRCVIYKSGTIFGTGEGSTPSEARARAMLAALEGLKARKAVAHV